MGSWASTFRTIIWVAYQYTYIVETYKFDTKMYLQLSPKVFIKNICSFHLITRQTQNLEIEILYGFAKIKKYIYQNNRALLLEFGLPH